MIIDADKFLSYLIFSKHIDDLTCGEVKEAVEMCKVDVLNKLRTEIEDYITHSPYIKSVKDCCRLRDDVMRIIDKYRNEVSS